MLSLSIIHNFPTIFFVNFRKKSLSNTQPTINNHTKSRNSNNTNISSCDLREEPIFCHLTSVTTYNKVQQSVTSVIDSNNSLMYILFHVSHHAVCGTFFAHASY